MSFLWVDSWHIAQTRVAKRISIANPVPCMYTWFVSMKRNKQQTIFTNFKSALQSAVLAHSPSLVPPGILCAIRDSSSLYLKQQRADAFSVMFCSLSLWAVFCFALAVRLVAVPQQFFPFRDSCLLFFHKLQSSPSPYLYSGNFHSASGCFSVDLSNSVVKSA